GGRVPELQRRSPRRQLAPVRAEGQATAVVHGDDPVANVQGVCRAPHLHGETLFAGGQVPDLGVVVDVARRDGAAVRAEGHVDARPIYTGSPSPLKVDDLAAGHLPDLEKILTTEAGQVATVRAKGEGQASLLPLIGEELAAGLHLPNLDAATAVRG